MASAEYDLNFFRAGLGELKDYLLGHELFRPIGIRPLASETPYPQFTIGNLLLFRARLQGRERGSSLTPAQVEELAVLEDSLHSIRTQWRVAWEEKVKREFASRLRQWSHFVAELHSDSAEHVAYYPHQVRLRAILELLAEYLPPSVSAELELLEKLDGSLRELTLPGEFLWGDELAPGFDPQRYEFLYRRPK